MSASFTSRRYLCPICQAFSRHNFKAVIRHIGQVHRHNPNFSIVCGLGDPRCPATYTKFESFRSHVYKKHKAELDVVVTSESDTQFSNEESPNTPSDRFSDNEGEGSGSSFPHLEIPSQDQLNRAAAMFILKTMEIHRTSQVAMDGIVEGVKSIVATTLDTAQANVQNIISHSSLSEDQVAAISAAISESFKLHPFQGLETRYQQEKFFANNFPCVEPDERVLGRYYDKNAKGGTVEKLDCCYDVSLIKSLQKMLSCEVVGKQIHQDRTSSDGKLRDFCDGSDFHEHDLFGRNHPTLQIHLYFDELEICNPLGSKASVHKLGIFYYSLGNLDAKLRSALHSIQLVTVIESKFIQKYGIDTVLQNFITDIIKLEEDEGVPFVVLGNKINLRGTLGIVSADNPAACLLGGFKQLHSAFRKCRFCMAVESNMRTEFHESKFDNRTIQKHSEHISDLKDIAIADHYRTTNGVERDSS